MRNRFLKPTVLVVDDDEASRGVLRDFVADDGFPVVTACDGADALRKASADIGIVILDYTMPKLDGLQTCRLLAARPESSKTPVILLSGISGAFLAGQIRTPNVYAVLEKPIRMGALLAHLNALSHLDQDATGTLAKQDFENALREEGYRQRMIELKARETWYALSQA